jgi:hypothetical protein
MHLFGHYDRCADDASSVFQLPPMAPGLIVVALADLHANMYADFLTAGSGSQSSESVVLKPCG